MYKSLADFITKLESAGELIRIGTSVSTTYEIAEITDRMVKSEGGGKALLFENTDKGFPVLTNMMGSERRIAMALGVDSLESLSERIESLLGQLTSPKESLGDKLRMLPLLGEMARWFPKKSRAKGACQQVVLTGEEAYSQIEDSLWHTSNNYVVVHRLCVDGTARRRGVAIELMAFAGDLAMKHGVTDFRIDTHEGNVRMLALLEKLGFEHVGTIRYESGLREAFDLKLNKN